MYKTSAKLYCNCTYRKSSILYIHYGILYLYEIKNQVLWNKKIEKRNKTQTNRNQRLKKNYTSKKNESKFSYDI